MPRSIAYGSRGADQYPGTLLAIKIIDSVTNRVPDLGGTLPFVNDMRAFTSEQSCGVCRSDIEIRAPVHIGNASGMAS